MQQRREGLSHRQGARAVLLRRRRCGAGAEAMAVILALVCRIVQSSGVLKDAAGS